MSSRAVGRATYAVRSLCWKVIRRVRRSVTLRTRHGLLTVDCADRCIAKSLFCRGEYELELMLRTTAHLRGAGLLPPKGTGTLLDIGANMGVTSVGLLHHGEFHGAVAIEPDARNYALLQRNVRQNGLDARTVCLSCAISDRNGKLAFELSDSNFGDHRLRVGDVPPDTKERYAESRRQVVEVESRRLDDVVGALPPELARSLALAWIDVQGFEGYVFAGGQRVWATGLPVMAEIWPYGIRRSKMTAEAFCEIVRSTWSSYWMVRGAPKRPHFVRYPTTCFETVFDELGFDGGYDNVMFTR
jgi:FkbM family methyltransferase